jgi:hypothetical protein
MLLAHAGKKQGNLARPHLFRQVPAGPGMPAGLSPDSGANRCASHRAGELRSSRQRDDWADQNSAHTAPQVGAGELLFLATPPDRAVPLSGKGITMQGTNQHMRVIGSALE